MTPIQQHEAELRAMMERAGLPSSDPDPRGYCWQVTHSDGHVMLIDCGVRVVATAWAGFGDDKRKLASAGHPDPRVALRHCLIMAGLLADAPPRTDEELAEWLTATYGAPTIHENRTDEWTTPSGGVFFDTDPTNGLCRWCDGQPARWTHAAEIGVRLWIAERFGEVAP